MGSNALATLAVFATLVSLLGVSLFWLRHRCFAFGFGVMHMPAFIATLALGIAVVKLTGYAMPVVDQFCADLIADSEDFRKARREGKTGGGLPDITLAQMGEMTPEELQERMTKDRKFRISYDMYEMLQVNVNMCTDHCPCVSTQYDSEWDSFVADQDLMELYERDGIRFGPVPGENVTVSTYMECIERTARGEMPQAWTIPSKLFQLFSERFTKSERFDMIKTFMTFLESRYTCAGVCETSAFGLTLPVTLGRPKKPCI